MSETFRRLSIADFEFAVSALSERRNHIFITGGRFSRLLAEMLHLHLFQIRPNVSTLVAGPAVARRSASRCRTEERARRL